MQRCVSYHVPVTQSGDCAAQSATHSRSPDCAETLNIRFGGTIIKKRKAPRDTSKTYVHLITRLTRLSMSAEYAELMYMYGRV